VTYDPKYKLRHKPTPIARLAHYKHLPPPMVGDPPAAPSWKAWGRWKNWDERCRAVYEDMIARKHGRLPRNEMRGLWFWGHRAQHEATCFELAG
jgi:hypothetical protein